MRWGLKGIVAAAVLYTAAVAYAGGNHTVRLSLDAPRVEVLLPVRLTDQASVLRVRIGAIDNPGLTPFGVVVRLPGGHEIGRFAIFPADRTGDYFLSLKPEEREALALSGVAVTLELDLIGKVSGRLGVEVDSVQIR